MDCTITLPVITKFSTTALHTLVATFLSLPINDVEISASYELEQALPTKVIAHVPDGSNCGQIQAHVAQNYNPNKSDEEEAQEKRVQGFDSRVSQTQTIQDIIQRLDVLEGQ